MRCHVFWSLDPPSGSFSFVFLFAFLLAACQTLFDTLFACSEPNKFIQNNGDITTSAVGECRV
jgi:uncharacterized iron-regulated protein